MRRLILLLVGLSLNVTCGKVRGDNAVIAKTPPNRLVTQWAAKVLAGEDHPEYPRPELVRSNWMSLNGKWNYTLSTLTGPVSGNRSGTILVPFPVESYLSGANDKFNAENILEYRRQFSVPADWLGKRVLLHFDAVNWEARVELNGKLLGIHQGGYDRFSFDITDALDGKDEQNLTVVVKNPMDHGMQPRGKQTSSPHGIWYTSSSGIWQTVWLEPVPWTSVESVNSNPDVDHGLLNLVTTVRGDTNDIKVEAVALDGIKVIGRALGVPGQAFSIPLENARLWSPEHPVLYDLRVSLRQGSKTIDSVTSYFGMRKISVATGSKGLPRIMLNNEPYFQLGVLDQGYWPDGIYTAPTDEAIKSDIELTRRLGFNLCRKHVKVESERWYYWCDRLGLLVWQDMPSTDNMASVRPKDPAYPAAAAKEFNSELVRIIGQNRNHPSIVMWVAFNEGWGQHDTAGVVDSIKKLDPDRLVIGASGWNDRGCGDVRSLHSYPGPAMPEFKDNRAVVCGECGGLGLTVSGHVWPSVPAWSYTHLNSPQKLAAAYSQLLDRIQQARQGGLSGAVITQLSDVEGEINGLATYDREIVKVDAIGEKFGSWNK